MGQISIIMADPTNTISSFTGRNKYFSANMQQVLRNALVAEKICLVDNSELLTIQNPYGSQVTATISDLTGTYTASNYTTTNDALTVTDEVKYAEHVYNFEQVTSNYDLYTTRMDEIAYGMVYAIDNWVVNNLCEDGTGTYSTPSGGFTTAANIIPIMANLNSKVGGFADAYRGTFLVIENTDMVGFEQAQATSGYSTADSALNNGFYRHFMGVDIFVLRSGAFVTTTLGTKVVSNSGHRVFGVKGCATYASPRGVQYEEITVQGRFGKEIRANAPIGFKLWAQKASLIVDITIV